MFNIQRHRDWHKRSKSLLIREKKAERFESGSFCAPRGQWDSSDSCGMTSEEGEGILVTTTPSSPFSLSLFLFPFPPNGHSPTHTWDFQSGTPHFFLNPNFSSSPSPLTICFPAEPTNRKFSQNGSEVKLYSVCYFAYTSEVPCYPFGIYLVLNLLISKPSALIYSFFIIF